MQVCVREFTFKKDDSDEAIRGVFDRFGIVIIKHLLDQDEIAEQREDIKLLLALRLQSLGEDRSETDDIDGIYARLAGLDRGYAIDIIRAAKDSPFFFRMMADKRLLRVSQACLGARSLLAVHDIAQFRIDPPDDDTRNFPWHQDFQYNVMSVNSVTVWYPLTPIAEDMGPLVVAPGTHHEILPVEVNFDQHASGSGTMHRVFRLRVDEEEAERRAVVLCPVDEGDVVFFHSLLLHRSGPNRSRRSRWTMNPRFGDALDPSFVARGWRAVRDKTQNLFEEQYPNLVVKMPARNH
jgi:ectoine hydroxylase-related dioxygenase (phytanoyl-CoA dioxygenase family)